VSIIGKHKEANTMRKFFIVFSFLFLMLPLVKTARASSAFDNTTLDGFDKVGYDSSAPGRKARWINFSSSGITGTGYVTSISFYLSPEGGGTSCLAGIYDSANSNVSSNQYITSAGWYTFSTSAWNLTFTQLGSGHNIYFDPTGNGCEGSQYLAIWGSNSAPTYSVTASGNEGSATHYTAFQLNGVSVPLSITAPPQNSLLSTSTSTPISGSCPVEGSNELMLTDSPFLARLATSTQFNVQCSEGGWSSSFIAKPGDNLIWIITNDVIGENPPDINNAERYQSLAYTGDSGALSWGLTLLTPILGDDGWIYAYPDSQYIFKFSPLIPITASSTSLYFGIKEFTTNGRLTATTTDEWLMSSVLLNGLLIHNFDFSATSTTARYYRAYIKNASTTTTYLDFNVVISDSATAQKTVGDGMYDLGKLGNLLRGLFVPSMSEFQPLVQAMQTRLSNTVPFSYFWQAKAIMDTQSITTSTPTTINFIIPSSVSGEATTTSPMPILGSVATDPVRSFSTQARPYVIAGLWIYFVGWVLVRFKDFLST